MTERYDTIVIGAGAAGGIVAAVLCEAGKRVLLLERGRALTFEEIGRDNLRNQRLALYGQNAGPDATGNPRVFVNAAGVATTVEPHQGGYNNNAVCVGGGTRVYGGQAWRFLPEDFRMATEYGVPQGSSLADWPISYEDLAPYYERAEWEIGVAGDGEAEPHRRYRTRGYPLPPLAPTLESSILSNAAQSLGWDPFTPPILLNTVPRAGRAACIGCRFCVGFGCPTDAKNGAHNTVIPRALATGLCTLHSRAMAERIDTDSAGEVTGVTYLQDSHGSLARHRAVASKVVVSCGAIESARLLLNSAAPLHPHGLGNGRDLVGRNLQGHYYPTAMGLMEEPVYDGEGPGAAIATCRFNHGNAGIVGGGMLANDFIKMPIVFWRGFRPPDIPRWGQANTEWMRRFYTRTLDVKGPVQETPSPNARVEVDSSVTDRYGLPVARLSGTTHPETVRSARFMLERAEEWLRAAGAYRVWSYPPSLGLSAGQHQAGTCRMGSDPAGSVVDPWCRVHGHDNLYVVDGSVHVTNGGFNPVLTIMALAFRAAEHIANT